MTHTFYLCTHNSQKRKALVDIKEWANGKYVDLPSLHLATLQKFGSVNDPGEIQSRDVLEIAKKKARDYFTKLNPTGLVNHRTICDDTSLDIPDLLIVGTYIKDIIQEFGLNRLWELTQGKKAVFSVAIAICIGPDPILAQKASIVGRIADRPPDAKKLSPKATFDDIFIPDGHDVVWSQIEKETLMEISPRTHAFIGAIHQLPSQK